MEHEQQPGSVDQVQPQGQQGNETAQKLYALSMMALYNKDFIPDAVDMIKGPNGPEIGMAHVVSTIAARVILAARDEGEEIPGNVVLYTGAEFMKEIADFANRFAGIKVDQAMMEDSFLIAADILKKQLDSQGFEFSDASEPGGAEAATEMAGGADAMMQIQARKKQAMTPQGARRMQRRAGLGAAMGGN